MLMWSLRPLRRALPLESPELAENQGGSPVLKGYPIDPRSATTSTPGLSWRNQKRTHTIEVEFCMEEYCCKSHGLSQLADSSSGHQGRAEGIATLMIRSPTSQAQGGMA